jgi:CBS domain-containing protein
MKLSDLFSKQPITAAPAATFASVVALMQKHNIGAVVITDGRRPVGIVTDRDVAIALGTQGFSPQSPVEKVMSRRVVAIPDDTGILGATTFIRRCEVRRLPVVDREDRLVGMVSLDDLLRVLAKELYNLAEGIRDEATVT